MVELPEHCSFEPQYITEKILQDELRKIIAERDLLRSALRDCEWSDEKLDELLTQAWGMING